MQNIKVLKEITGKHAHDLEVQNNLMTKTTKYKRNIFKVWKKCNIENKILCIKIMNFFFIQGVSLKTVNFGEFLTELQWISRWFCK